MEHTSKSLEEMWQYLLEHRENGWEKAQDEDPDHTAVFRPVMYIVPPTDQNEPVKLPDTPTSELAQKMVAKLFAMKDYPKPSAIIFVREVSFSQPEIKKLGEMAEQVKRGEVPEELRELVAGKLNDPIEMQSGVIFAMIWLEWKSSDPKWIAEKLEATDSDCTEFITFKTRMALVPAEIQNVKGHGEITAFKGEPIDLARDEECVSLAASELDFSDAVPVNQTTNAGVDPLFVQVIDKDLFGSLWPVYAE